jgi:hypothetical protein
VPSFPDTRLRQAGISAARVAQLLAQYDAMTPPQQAQFRGIVASRPDEVLRRTYDPGGVPPDPGASVAQVVADPALLTAVQTAILAAHDTDAERETFIPSRLAAGALAGFGLMRGPLPPGAQVPPRVVATCETGVVNDSGAGNGTVAHDATVAAFGAASVKITPAGNGNAAKATFPLTAQDWTNDGITFWVRSDAWANITDGYLLISTAGVFGSFFTCQFRPMIARAVNGEWTQVSFTRGDFTVGAGTPTWATVNRIMFQVYSATGTTPNLWIDQIERNRGSRRGVVAIGFDDGFATTATLAKPYMDGYGFRGSTNIILGRIGTNGFMSQAQIDGLADAGWDISAHAENDLTTLAFAAAETDVSAIKAYLDDRNYKGRNIYVYALGGQNTALRAMVRKYFAAARGTSTSGQYLSRLNPTNFTARQAGQAISVATITGWIAQAAADGRFLPLIFHNLPATTSLAEDVLPANFRAVMDYLATANVDVLTISEALARGPWGPSEPPVLTAPSGANYALTVGSDGALTTTALT